MKKLDMIEDFLEKRLITAPSTRRNYRMNIQTYFKILNKDMDTYFTTKQDYDADLRKIYTHYTKAGRPILSTRTFFNSIKQFMVTNNKQLKDLDFWDTFKARTRGAEPEYDETRMNAEDIRTILAHADTKSKALFLMLASSGRRISEILALTPDDINTNVKPTTINIRKGLERKSTKTGQKTLCYISDEATKAYQTWMKERDSYLETACRKSAKQGPRGKKMDKDPDDPRIFPMSYWNTRVMWATLLMRSKVVETERYKNKWSGKQSKKVKRGHKGERLLQHPHCLRKFFRSYLGDADLSEYLMGHSTVMTRTYRQKKPEDLAADYLQLMQNVTIFEKTPKDIQELQQKDHEKDEKIQKLEENQRILELTLQSLQNSLDIEKMKNGKPAKK